MIAQLNVAYAKAPLESPEMAEFMNNLDRINELAETSQGFVWRLQDVDGNATSIRVTQDPRFILNLSVWHSVKDLHHFVFRTDHKEFVRRRDDWFMPSDTASVILWQLNDDTVMPSLDDAFRRLEKFNKIGPSIDAFTWQTAKDFGVK